VSSYGERTSRKRKRRGGREHGRILLLMHKSIRTVSDLFEGKKSEKDGEYKYAELSLHRAKKKKKTLACYPFQGWCRGNGGGEGEGGGRGASSRGPVHRWRGGGRRGKKRKLRSFFLSGRLARKEEDSKSAPLSFPPPPFSHLQTANAAGYSQGGRKEVVCLLITLISFIGKERGPKGGNSLFTTNSSGREKGEKEGGCLPSAPLYLGGGREEEKD